MKPLSKRKLESIPVVDLGEIYLRAVEFEDYHDMFEYGSDDEVTKMLAWNSYQTIDDAKNSVEHVFLSRPNRGIPAAYAIVHTKTDKMIGTCDIFTVDWNTGEGEIGYVIHKDYWGKGYMTKACNAVIAFGFNYLKLKKIHIKHHPDNIGSRRVIEKCGFHYVRDEYYSIYDCDIPAYVLQRKEWLSK